MEKDKKNKLIVLISGIVVILLMVFGISFAIFRFGSESTNQELVLGDIWMKYTESNGISLENSLPGDEYTNYFEFTITGTNTYTKKDIWYDISLTKGDIPSGKVESDRIGDKYLKFRLIEIIDGVETEIFTDKTYDDLTNKRVHVDTISKSTSTYSKTYRLYMVISEDLTYGNSSDAILSTEEFGKIFGSIKVNVTGDFTEKELPKSAADTIKENIVPHAVSSASDFTGGLVGINTNGTLYNETTSEEVREYRYSGADVDNYIYYNCPDTAGGKTYGDLDYDYANNCETWRIVGIFEENGEEFLKIMNNNTLTDIPTNYVIDGTTYTVGYNGTHAYWNRPDTLKSTNYNDWTRAGLQYYLNTEEDESATPVAGYLSKLSTNAKNVLRETTYYLGNVAYGGSGDTTISAYANERNATKIWSENQPTWNGKVGLLYPSDYGYSANPDNWSNTQLYYYDGATTWMMQNANHNDHEWLLSPSSGSANHALYWYSAGYVYFTDIVNGSTGVREVLNLKSSVKVLKGEGDVNSPYVVIED